MTVGLQMRFIIVLSLQVRSFICETVITYFSKRAFGSLLLIFDYFLPGLTFLAQNGCIFFSFFVFIFFIFVFLLSRVSFLTDGWVVLCVFFFFREQAQN